MCVCMNDSVHFFSLFIIFIALIMHHVHVTVPVPLSGLPHDVSSDTSVDG